MIIESPSNFPSPYTIHHGPNHFTLNWNAIANPRSGKNPKQNL